MIRKYRPSDYDFVLNGVASIQKKIKMSGMPLVSKNRRSKQEMSARFLKKLIIPQNLCFIFLDSSGRRIGFTCFKPINSKVCFFEFFFTALFWFSKNGCFFRHSWDWCFFIHFLLRLVFFYDFLLLRLVFFSTSLRFVFFFTVSWG